MLVIINGDQGSVEEDNMVFQIHQLNLQAHTETTNNLIENYLISCYTGSYEKNRLTAETISTNKKS